MDDAAAAATQADPATGAAAFGSPTVSTRRLPTVAFIAIEVVALIVFFRAGRGAWFGWDDWDFLAERTAGDVSDLLEPHGDHWSLLPILTYRSLWTVFGLRFVPYLVTAILVHLGIAVLLRVVMRRAGVTPWIATAAAGLYALFGTGYENTIQLFGLHFGGWAVVLGLTQLLLADHPGPLQRRDVLGVAAGLGAVASSGLGVPMVVAVGVATMWRGAKVAAFHVLPVLAIYGLWYLTYASRASGASFWDTLSFARRTVVDLFLGLGQSEAAALVLAALSIVGLALASRERPAHVRLSMPMGLLAGAALFLLVTGYGRSDLVKGGVSHYVDFVALMTLPAIAIGATAVAHRVPRAAPFIPLLFLLGVPGNLEALDSAGTAAEQSSTKDLILSLPIAPQARDALPAHVPEPLIARGVTIGWLLSASDSGRVPAPSNGPSPLLSEQIALRLSIHQTPDAYIGGPCQHVTSPAVRHLEWGDRIGIGAEDSVWLSMSKPPGWSAPVRYGRPYSDRYEEVPGLTLTVLRGPLTLRLEPGDGKGFRLCG